MTSTGLTFSVASAVEELAGRVGVLAGRHPYVDDLPVLVDRPVHVAPHPVDLHVRLVHEPPITRAVPAEPGGVEQQRGEPLHPSVDRDVINLDSALEQEFFNVAIGQAEPQVPTDCDGDHLGREPEPGERRPRRQPRTKTTR